MDDDERGIYLMLDDIWHPKPIMASGSDSEYTDHCITKLASITFRQELRTPAHSGLTLEKSLEEGAEEITWFNAPSSV